MINVYNGILLCNKKEWSLVMDENGGCYVKWNKSETERQTSHYLCLFLCGKLLCH
jgi:hypothetical protein